MRSFIIVALCILLALPALADKPHHETSAPSSRVPCGLTSVVHDWDFAVSDHGFTTASCDDQGAFMWEHGATSYIPDAPGNVWGTVLEGNYPIEGGEALVSPTFTVEATTYLFEIFHYYDAENLWDGGNVKVNGQSVAPLVGYPGMISVPGDWYAWCVDFQMGFTGTDSGWLTSCFDLSAFIGQEVTVTFEFGSDDAYVEAGWYIASMRVGSDQGVPTEKKSFSEIKGTFK